MNIEKVTKTFQLIERMPGIQSITETEWFDNIEQAVSMHTLNKDNHLFEERVADLLAHFRGY